MLIRRLIYVLLIIFCMWLAFATRLHADRFWPFIAKYGGDIIWSAQFLFLLRIIFIRASLLRLAFINYILGVLVEVSQIYHAPWINNIRSTAVGEALLGLGFLWSDLACYAAGTLIAYLFCVLVDRYTA
jgi:hypothetical protein